MVNAIKQPAAPGTIRNTQSWNYDDAGNCAPSAHTKQSAISSSGNGIAEMEQMLQVLWNSTTIDLSAIASATADGTAERNDRIGSFMDGGEAVARRVYFGRDEQKHQNRSHTTADQISLLAGNVVTNDLKGNLTAFTHDNLAAEVVGLSEERGHFAQKLACKAASKA